MKFSAFALTLATSDAFVPSKSFIKSDHRKRILKATIVEHDPTSTTIERKAPEAGYWPKWEGRQGLEPKEFLLSDPDAQDLSAMWESPLTLWNTENIDIRSAQGEANRATLRAPDFPLFPSTKRKDFPLEIRASPEDNGKGLQYFVENKERIRKQLLIYGGIWFRGFDLMKSVKGYREMWQALGFEPCLDPLHSSGLRKFASEPDALYEEVNKPSLRGHYIGLHNESTAKRTPAYAAFVCFQSATEKEEPRGRFIVADGAAILADIDPVVLKKLYERKIRISVSNLDIPPDFPEPVKEGIKWVVDKAVAPKFDMDLEMLYGRDGTPGRLQAVECAESPINRHPITGLPVWFNNSHNHARKLRDRRPCGVPEVGMTEVFYADTMEPLSLEDCQEIKRASESNIAALSMEPGDVMLLDNYRALHGRDVFGGDRFHAVTWFTWDQNPEWRGNERRILEKSVLNKVINQMMDWLPKDFESNQSEAS